MAITKLEKLFYEYEEVIQEMMKQNFARGLPIVKELIFKQKEIADMVKKLGYIADRLQEIVTLHEKELAETERILLNA